MDYQLISECQSEAINYYKQALSLIKDCAHLLINGANPAETANLILRAAINGEVFADEAMSDLDEPNPESEVEPANLDEYRERRDEERGTHYEMKWAE